MCNLLKLCCGKTNIKRYFCFFEFKIIAKRIALLSFLFIILVVFFTLSRIPRPIDPKAPLIVCSWEPPYFVNIKNTYSFVFFLVFNGTEQSIKIIPITVVSGSAKG